MCAFWGAGPALPSHESPLLPISGDFLTLPGAYSNKVLMKCEYPAPQSGCRRFGISPCSMDARVSTVTDDLSVGVRGAQLSKPTKDGATDFAMESAGSKLGQPPLTYDFHQGADNGNVYQIANGRDATRTQNFTYDPLNRIAEAWTSGPNWGERFTIDPWGNLTNRDPIPGKTYYEPLSAAPALANNQLTGYGYDAAGNMTQNQTATYAYDAEGRLSATAGVTYTYDGDGDRVMKSNGTLYWGSGPLAESDASGNVQKEYIFFDGGRVARLDVPTNNVHYYFSNHLDTTSVVTNSSGTAPFDEDLDYYPYGGEVTGSAENVAQNYKFTGKERDTESGLDMFGARYYGSSLGRFMTPDWSEEPEPAPYADLHDPQSLNLYSYARNNPMSNTDDDGHDCTQDANGNVHCIVNEKAPDDPKINRAYLLGAIALENEELGPYAWGSAALLFTYGCIQTHCLNIFSQSKDKDTPSPPPADTSSSTSKTASPNPDPNQQKGKPDDKKKADDQIRGRLRKSTSYSSEYGNKTYAEIKELAKAGDAKAKAMKKLIDQSARLMEKVGNK